MFPFSFLSFSNATLDYRVKFQQEECEYFHRLDHTFVETINKRRKMVSGFFDRRTELSHSASSSCEFFFRIHPGPSFPPSPSFQSVAQSNFISSINISRSSIETGQLRSNYLPARINCTSECQTRVCVCVCVYTLQPKGETIIIVTVEIETRVGRKFRSTMENRELFT